MGLKLMTPKSRVTYSSDWASQVPLEQVVLISFWDSAPGSTDSKLRFMDELHFSDSFYMQGAFSGDMGLVIFFKDSASHRSSLLFPWHKQSLKEDTSKRGEESPPAGSVRLSLCWPGLLLGRVGREGLPDSSVSLALSMLSCFGLSLIWFLGRALCSGASWKGSSLAVVRSGWDTQARVASQRASSTVHPWHPALY